MIDKEYITYSIVQKIFMAIKSCVNNSYRNLVKSGVLPMAALSNYFNLEEITTARKISAAVINISGRQRMLSQRMALCKHKTYHPSFS